MLQQHATFLGSALRGADNQPIFKAGQRQHRARKSVRASIVDRRYSLLHLKVSGEEGGSDGSTIWTDEWPSGVIHSKKLRPKLGARNPANKILAAMQKKRRECI